ncbi:DUF1120 domain-containing protein [Pseudomonas sp. CCM 7893]|uniref:DUF1120 domain-containing protein n=1 Tax=Pseudomonas spelaei TaxID=1055469 RepID=A0A6I3W7L1_9PSED|nr:DUF1120 domain-containing protein [Pseudomonas spelaei]MUF02716.1 DUF1120 domain-containing protein [Pseudomonas spelaei]
MNKHLIAFGSALLITASLPTFADSRVELTVTGKITPSACTPALSGNGVVDFGKISAKDLKPDRHTNLENRAVQLIVTCEASTRFAIKPRDNRSGSSSIPGNISYGLGMINGNEKLGRYFLNFINPVSDIPLTALYSANNGATWGEHLDGDAAIPGQLFAFGSRGDDWAWAPLPLQSVTVDITLNTAIAPTNSLTLTDEVEKDGSATLEMIYL